MARKKKYVMVKDLSELEVNVLATLKKTPEYVEKVYSITTSGGKNILWQVNEKTGTIYTVSTGEIGRVRVNPHITVPKYKHYVLSPEGIRFVKGIVMEKVI